MTLSAGATTARHETLAILMGRHEPEIANDPFC